MKENQYIKPSKKIQEYLSSKTSIYKTINDKRHSENNICLDKNENPYGPPFEEYPSINLLEILGKYPDSNCFDFLNKLSEVLQIPKSYLIAGAGSDELLDLIFRTFLNDNDIVLTIKPTFSMYEMYAAINGGYYESIPLKLSLDRSTGIATFNLEENLFLKRGRSAKIIILARPNNPDGNLISKRFIDRLLDLNKLTIIDEAYIDFSENSSVADLLNKHSNLIVLRTFSKAYALAGLRLGYAILDPSINELLLKVKSPFNVNTLASRFGVLLLGSKDKLSDNIQKIKSTREKVIQKLLELGTNTNKFYVHLSKGNFILIRFNSSKIAESVYQFLLKSHIYVRKFDDLPDCIRISIGTRIQMDKILENLKKYFEVNNIG